MRTLNLATITALAAAFACPALHAQRVAPAEPDDPATAQPAPAVPVKTKPAPKEDIGETIEMSVFNVQAQRDEGYQAANTVSGSRLNTSLMDTAAAISPFTAEFIEDLGLNTLGDILSFAGNVEMESTDHTQYRYAGGSNGTINIRGLGASVSINFVGSNIPVDMYNIDRVEVASGANSIIFGMGAQGGAITNTYKRAHLQRNTFKLMSAMATNDGSGYADGPSWNYKRTTLDYNIVLIPRQMSIRLLGLYQDGANNSWRRWMFHQEKRINPAIMIKPAKNTNIHMRFEAGSIKQGRTRNWNAADQYSAWDMAGRPIMEGFGAAYALPTITIDTPKGTSYEQPTTTALRTGAPVYVFVMNNTTMYDYRRAYQSTSIYRVNPDMDTLGDVAQISAPESISPYSYSTAGPGGYHNEKFQNWEIVADQRIGKFNFELGYYYNKNDTFANAPDDSLTRLRGNPNAYVSSYIWNGAADVVPDPYSGRLYMENNWTESTYRETNDVFRLTTEYTANLKKFGRHRLIGLVEHARRDLRRNVKNEILVDRDQVPIYANGPNDLVTSAYNRVIRRQYLTEGDFSTYYEGDPRVPIDEFVLGDKTYHSTYATMRENLSHVTQATLTYMLAAQSYWFNDKLVTTLGLRLDDITFRVENTARVNAGDPRILNHTKVVNEYALDGTWSPRYKFNPVTFTTGAVWHLSRFFHPFANFSTNRGAPRLDGSTVLPTGDIPEVTKGRSLDYGVKINALGDNRVFLSILRFDTRQSGNASISPNGTNTPHAVSLGSTHLYNIYDALFFLYSTTQGGRDPAGGWPAGTGPGMGPMTAEQYAVFPATDDKPYGRPPLYNVATLDMNSKGYEVELVANPTKNLTLRFTFSYLDRNRSKIMPEIFDYFETNIPVWMDMLNPGSPGYKPNPNSPDGIYYMNGGTSLVPGAQTVRDYIRNQLYAPGGVRDGLAYRLLIAGGPVDSRPWKFNFTTRYRLPGKLLSGLAIGGSLRFRSSNLMMDPSRIQQDLDGMPPENCTDLALDRSYYDGTADTLKGSSLWFADAFMSYKRRVNVFGRRVLMSLQLNVTNLCNKYVAVPGTLVTTEFGILSYRVHLNNPRQIRITSGFEF